MSEKIYLASPHMCGEEMKYIKEAFDTNWIAPLGKNVNEFEKDICKYVNIENATALSSGTSALHMAIRALGIGRGDVVFCSSLTFSATANPIIYENAEPVFIDCDYETWNMCPIALQKAFDDAQKHGKMPKAVIVVNLYGQSADFDKLLEVCNKYRVPIIEDAAESLGATYKGRFTGTIGEIGIYSFNGNKIITTSGGGMMVSKNKKYNDKVLFWATQSREAKRYYEHKELGFNYRMSNIVAGIGRGQITVIDERIKRKKEIFNKYKDGFKDIDDLEMMNICDYGEANYWLSVATINKNSKIKIIDIIEKLEKENIESRHVWKPMHLQPYFKKYKFYSKLDNKSISEDLFNRGICLPSDTKMSDEQIDKIIEIIKELFSDNKVENLQDIYFTKKYGQIYEDNKDGILETYLYEDSNGKVIYRFLKRKIDIIKDCKLYDISTPYGYGGPLFLNYKEENLDKLIISFKKNFEVYCNKNNIVSEFVRFHPILENYKDMNLYMDIENIRNTICMELKDEEYLWNNLSQKCKNRIRKARKNGIEIIKGSKRDDLEEFYDLYTETMVKNCASDYYYFSKEFFQDTLDLLGDNVEIFKAIYEGKTILSGLIMKYENFAHYHLSGSKKEYLNLGVNNLYIYEVAKWALEYGCKYFHLGGGYEGNNDGLYRFKKGFSINKEGEKKFYIGRKINMKREYDKLVEIRKNNMENIKMNFFPEYRG